MAEKQTTNKATSRSSSKAGGEGKSESAHTHERLAYLDDQSSKHATDITNNHVAIVEGLKSVREEFTANAQAALDQRLVEQKARESLADRVARLEGQLKGERQACEQIQARMGLVAGMVIDVARQLLPFMKGVSQSPGVAGSEQLLMNDAARVGDVVSEFIEAAGIDTASEAVAMFNVAYASVQVDVITAEAEGTPPQFSQAEMDEMVDEASEGKADAPPPSDRHVWCEEMLLGGLLHHPGKNVGQRWIASLKPAHFTSPAMQAVYEGLLWFAGPGGQRDIFEDDIPTLIVGETRGAARDLTTAMVYKLHDAYVDECAEADIDDMTPDMLDTFANSIIRSTIVGDDEAFSWMKDALPDEGQLEEFASPSDPDDPGDLDDLDDLD